VVLFIAKLIIGLSIGSVAVIADAVHSLTDLGATGVSLISFIAGNKPADKEHPFGHDRIEYLASLVIAFIIGILGYEFLAASIDKVIHPVALTYEIPALCVLSAAVLISFFIAWVYKVAGGLIQAPTLLAASKDARYDVFTTLVVIVSAVFSMWFHWHIDGYAGVFVACMLFKCAYEIARDAVSPLLGERPDRELTAKIKKMVESYDGVVGTHDLIIHNYGPNRSMATIHAEVPEDAGIKASHQIIDRIEQDVSKKLEINLLIHMDPIDMRDERVKELKRLVEGAIADKPGLNVHDLRIIDGGDRTNLVFDMVIPYQYSKKQQSDIRNVIIDKLDSYGGNYNCVINFEYGFVGQ